MKCNNPYTMLGKRRVQITWVAVIVSWIMTAFVLNQGTPLSDFKLDGQPSTIVDLELASTSDDAEEILKGWAETSTTEGKSLTRIARDGIYYDFPFIVTYVVAIMLVCGYAAEGMEGWKRQLILLVAWSQILAGILDIVENLLMLRMLSEGSVSDSLVPQITSVCAKTKFLIAGIGIVVGVFGSLRKWFGWGHDRSEATS